MVCRSNKFVSNQSRKPVGYISNTLNTLFSVLSQDEFFRYNVNNPSLIGKTSFHSRTFPIFTLSGHRGYRHDDSTQGRIWKQGGQLSNLYILPDQRHQTFWSIGFDGTKNNLPFPFVTKMSTDFYDKHLKAFPRPRPVLDHEDVPFFGSLPELLRNIRESLKLNVVFVRAGGSLPDLCARCFTIKVEGGQSPGHLVLIPPKYIAGTPAHAAGPSLTEKQQDAFLSSLALLLGDAYRWQQRFRKYEEELASLIPVPSIQPNKTVYTELLYNILKDGAKILDCHAVSLYILDERSQTLSLRSCWGLPEERLLAPARSLHDSLADVEAILGQAVIINEQYMLETWKVPELFASSLCVPVASPMSILGTLWFFSDEIRDFNEKELAVVELIAGRIATELERAALLREVS